MTEGAKESLATVTPERVSAIIETAGQDCDAQMELLLADAKRQGFDLTAADFEVTAEEPQEPDGANLCICFAGGGGELHDEEICWCVLAGAGGAPGECSCSCAIYGHGA